MTANGVSREPSISAVTPNRSRPQRHPMREESEIREQYEYLQEQLDSEEMNHEGVREMFTYYKRALGWVLEEEHI